MVCGLCRDPDHTWVRLGYVCRSFSYLDIVLADRRGWSNPILSYPILYIKTHRLETKTHSDWLLIPNSVSHWLMGIFISHWLPAPFTFTWQPDHGSPLLGSRAPDILPLFSTVPLLLTSIRSSPIRSCNATLRPPMLCSHVSHRGDFTGMSFRLAHGTYPDKSPAEAYV